MTRTVRLFAATAVVLVGGSVAAATAAAPASSAPMHVTFNILSVGIESVASPTNFAVRSGGTVQLTVRNHTSFFHTFTVPALEITLLVPPHQSATTTFVAPYGVYSWRCVICSTGSHPHMHHMGGKMYAIVND
jgi:nitrous oxide reductase